MVSLSLHSTVVCTGKFVHHTINHVDKYYAFSSHFCLNTCSARDNYAHARTVDTRLFFSPPTKSLGTRLGLKKLTDFWPVTTGCKLISLLFLPPFFLVLQRRMQEENLRKQEESVQKQEAMRRGTLLIIEPLYQPLFLYSCAHTHTPHHHTLTSSHRHN